MHIWVDADACPAVIKDILFRAAERTRISMTLVANAPMRIPASPHIRFMQVAAGADIADQRIVELLAPRDLVITADIPFAAAVIEKGGHAINPRGELYTRDNIRERLAQFHGRVTQQRCRHRRPGGVGPKRQAGICKQS